MSDWQQIVRKHGPAVWQTAYRLLGNDADAADCFQETFVSALEVSRSQRVRNFPALLARLATIRAIDQLRQRFRHSRLRTDEVNYSAIESTDPGPVEQVHDHELADQLRRAVAQLPPPEAEAFCLRYLNDMTYRQISKELRIKTNAVGVLLHRSRTKLRNYFGVNTVTVNQDK